MIHLGPLGELGSKLHPYFGYKRALAIKGRWRLSGRVQYPCKHISLKISEKKKKEEENQGQGAFVTFP